MSKIDDEITINGITYVAVLDIVAFLNPETSAECNNCDVMSDTGRCVLDYDATYSCLVDEGEIEFIWRRKDG